MKLMFILFVFFIRFLGLVLINIAINWFIPSIHVNFLVDLILFTGITLVTFNIKLNLNK